MTTDGAKNERLGASQLVKEGNDIHCKAHNIQLVINDVFRTTQAHPLRSVQSIDAWFANAMTWWYLSMATRAFTHHFQC